MTYPPLPPGNGGQFPPPSDPYQSYQSPQPDPYQPYQPPQPQQPAQPYQAVQPFQPVQPYQPPLSFVPDNNPYQQPQYQAQPYDYGYGSPYSQGFGGAPMKPPTEGLAIASLVLSCVAVAGVCAWGLGGLLGVAGAIMGHVAQRKIRAGATSGSGLALGGIIVGWIASALSLLVLGLLVFSIATDSSSPY